MKPTLNHFTNMEEKKRVYIVIWRNYYTGDAVFRDVFFNKEAAEEWIKGCSLPHEYEIECFEEAEEGTSKEVY